jgi:predicted nucleotidyltransferase
MPISGSIVPDMGIENDTPRKVSEAAARYASANLSDALFTSTQQRVLACLFAQPGRSCTISELIQVTGAGSGAVQREVARLAGSGLLTMAKVGNQKHYRANPDAPIHDELVAIVQKTFGLATPLRAALAPLADRIRAAFIFGSVAKRGDTAGSDIDLVVLSDTLTYAELMAVLHPVGELLQRQVNPIVHTPSQWQQQVQERRGFATRVQGQDKIWLLGDEHAPGA